MFEDAVRISRDCSSTVTGPRSLAALFKRELAFSIIPAPLF